MPARFASATTGSVSVLAGGGGSERRSVVVVVEVVVVHVDKVEDNEEEHGETGVKANVRVVVHSKAAVTKICTVRIMVMALLWGG